MGSYQTLDYVFLCTHCLKLFVTARTPAWPSTVIDLIASESVYTFLNSSLGTVQACYVTPPGSDEVEVTYGAGVSTNVKQWSPSTECEDIIPSDFLSSLHSKF